MLPAAARSIVLWEKPDPFHQLIDERARANPVQEDPLLLDAMPRITCTFAVGLLPWGEMRFVTKCSVHSH